MEIFELEGPVEAILFASGDPISVDRIAAILAAEKDDILSAAKNLDERYKERSAGICIVRLDDKLQMCSAAMYADFVRLALETRKPPQLSQPASEVLAIVAYFQPVTKAYIEQVRGVDSAYTINQLLDRSLIETAGRLSVPGRPMLYKTTDVFLRTFSISSLEELPPLPQADEDLEGQAKLEKAIADLQADQVIEEEIKAE